MNPVILKDTKIAVKFYLLVSSSYKPHITVHVIRLSKQLTELHSLYPYRVQYSQQCHPYICKYSFPHRSQPPGTQ